MSTRYSIPVGEDRERSSWNHIKPYESPMIPLEIPTDDDTMVPVEEVPEPVTLAEAVPVRVVEFVREPDRFRDARMFQIAVGPGSTVALPRRSQRRRVTLVNMDTALNVYLGHDRGVNGSNGFPLRPTDQPRSMDTQRSYYLHNADLTTAIVVGVIDEFVTELS